MIGFLSSAAEWQIFAILFFLYIGILPIGRLLIEGRSYNISYSSAYGDIALILVVLIAKEVLGRHPAPAWLAGHSYQTITFIICFAVGTIDHVVAMATGKWRFGTLMDFYHNVFILPLLLYSLATAVPLIFTEGTSSERWYVVILFEIWVYLFVADLCTGRIQQPRYLEKHQTTQV